ncbi:hypothetical protein ABZ639_24260 [Saccharomonospora sp. NPDC006951]
MDQNWRYFGYDINRLRREMAGEGVHTYDNVATTYSAHWNQGKTAERMTVPPELPEEAQTPAPDDEFNSLTIERIKDQIMGEQPGTTMDRAIYWSNVESMLFFVQNELFDQTDGLAADWESPAAKEAYLTKVGETLAHIEMWREAAEANHVGLSSLAGAMWSAQDRMKELWRRYQEALIKAADNSWGGQPLDDDPNRDKYREYILSQPRDLFVEPVREEYNEEARRLISETADSYSSAISKLETARANRMEPMNAILHPAATGEPIPSLPSVGSLNIHGVPSAFNGPVPAPPGGAPRAPDSVPSAALTASPPSVPSASPAVPVAGNWRHLGRTTAPQGHVPPPPFASSAVKPGNSPSIPPGGSTIRPAVGAPGRIMPPPGGAGVQSLKQGKVLDNRVTNSAESGTGQGFGVKPPPATGVPPGNRRDDKQAASSEEPGKLESQEAFRVPPPSSPGLLGATKNTKTTKKRQKPAPPAERAQVPWGVVPPVVSNARLATRGNAGKKPGKRPAVVEGAVSSEFTAGVGTGVTPVFEGGLAEPRELSGQRLRGDVPGALRGQAPTAAQAGSGAVQADRAARSLPRSVSNPPQRTDESWEVTTPGGPVVSGTQNEEYRAEPRKTLGLR